MPLDTRKLALEQFLARRARRRNATIARGTERSQAVRRATATPDVAVAPIHVPVPAALRRYNGPAVRRLLMVGNRRGYVTFDEVNDILPTSEISFGGDRGCSRGDRRAWLQVDRESMTAVAIVV